MKGGQAELEGTPLSQDMLEDDKEVISPHDMEVVVEDETSTSYKSSNVVWLCGTDLKLCIAEKLLESPLKHSSNKKTVVRNTMME